MNETTKAEFWLCLARAFLPPQTEAAQRALRDHLADDLTELAQALAYPVIEDIDSWRATIARIPDGQSLLALYSRLFLVPGTRHPSINAAVYLDGVVHGEAVRQLAECYRSCGLEKDYSLADLPDHAAVQLEFVAWLYASAAAGTQGEATPATPITAGEFIGRFVARWAPALTYELEQAGDHFGLQDNPWLYLARILESAAEIEAGSLEQGTQNREAGVDDEITRLRRQYAGHTPDAFDLSRLRATLEAQGLDASHIDIPVAERDAADGFTRMNPPQPPHHSLKSTCGD